MKISRNILVISGPTGVGESTVTKEIIKKYPIFQRLVTATTRKPRLKERDKRDYYFFSKNKFLTEIKKGNIVEYTYIKKRDTYYGTYEPILKKKINEKINLIVNPDLVGAKYYQKNYNAITIFLLPDSIADLKRRLLKREPNMQKEELNKRLEYAKYELENEAEFYDYKIYNQYGKLEKTIEEIIKIIKRRGYRLA